MEITWETVGAVVICLLVLGVLAVVAGFIDAAAEDRKCRREQAEREELERRRKTK